MQLCGKGLSFGSEMEETKTLKQTISTKIILHYHHSLTFPNFSRFRQLTKWNMFDYSKLLFIFSLGPIQKRKPHLCFWRSDLHALKKRLRYLPKFKFTAQQGSWGMKEAKKSMTFLFSWSTVVSSVCHCIPKLSTVEHYRLKYYLPHDWRRTKLGDPIAYFQYNMETITDISIWGIILASEHLQVKLSESVTSVLMMNFQSKTWIIGESLPQNQLGHNASNLPSDDISFNLGSNGICIKIQLTSRWLPG